MSVNLDHVREGFIRRRRNLVVMSLVILCFELLGVQFKTLNLLGNKVDLHNQGLVHVALWILLIYYLWRYYTAFNDIGDKGIIGSFYGWRREYIRQGIENRALKSDEIVAALKDFKESTISGTTVDHRTDKPMSTTGIVHVNLEGKSFGTAQRNVDFNMTSRELIIPSLRSMLHLIFRTSLFNEYLLPFFIFTLPLIFLDSSAVSWVLSLFSSK